MRTTFGTLWVGDRFLAHGSLWTRLTHQTARMHSPHSIQMGDRGGGYMLDTICTFERDDEVQFVGVRDPVVAGPIRWERRQGFRGLRGAWTWGNWQECTEQDVRRIAGLRSWEWRSSGGGTRVEQIPLTQEQRKSLCVTGDVSIPGAAEGDRQ